MSKFMSAVLPSVVAVEIDATHIRLGGSFRLPPVKAVAAEVADNGRIRVGGSFRLLAA